MLKRKVEQQFLTWKKTSKKALLVTGARQIGKSYAIREFGRQHYHSYVEFNLLNDQEAKAAFSSATSAADLINRIVLLAGKSLQEGDTLVLIDEIQEHPDIMTMAKFLVEDGRFSYAFSGSMLGTEFKGVRSFPVGYVHEIRMFPLDFEEYCWGASVPESALDEVRSAFADRRPVETITHEKLMRTFHSYLVVGGMPEVVQRYVDNSYVLSTVRELQTELNGQYRYDIGKYAGIRALRVRDIFDQLPLQLEEKSDRFKIASLGKNARYDRFAEEFSWLVNAGVALKTAQVSEAKPPLKRAETPSLFKLYQSDIGMLVARYPQSTARALYLDESAPNFGGIYENVIAQELAAQRITPYYYAKDEIGEVDFVIEGRRGHVVPIEVKSGRKFRTHAALNRLLQNKESRASEDIVLCRHNTEVDEKISYLPFYMAMCLKELTESEEPDFVLSPGWN